MGNQDAIYTRARQSVGGQRGLGPVEEFGYDRTLEGGCCDVDVVGVCRADCYADHGERVPVAVGDSAQNAPGPFGSSLGRDEERAQRVSHVDDAAVGG